MIVGTEKAYDSNFFATLPKEVENPANYYTKLLANLCLMNKHFPLLKYVILPTSKPYTAFIQGILLPASVINGKLLERDEYGKYGLYVYCDIPENYSQVGIKVYDARKRINWEDIPFEIRHCIPLIAKNQEDERSRIICTHHSSDINDKNCIVNVLYSAYYLFEEYRKFDRTGNFDLECLPHGTARQKEG